MEEWQVGLALGGCAVILLGIGVGQMRFGGPNPQQQPRASALPAIEERRPEASDRQAEGSGCPSHLRSSSEPSSEAPGGLSRLEAATALKARTDNRVVRV